MVTWPQFYQKTAMHAKLDPRNSEYVCLKECTFLNAHHKAKKNNAFCVLTDLLSTVVLIAALFHGRGNGCTEMLEGT